MSFDIRHVTIHDAKLLFDWANDKITRQNSFNSELIKWEDHINWLQNRLNRTDNLMYLFVLDLDPIGLVRFDIAKETIIGITISPAHRGKGFGSELLKLACNKFWETNSDSILAYIKNDNYASQKAFRNAGFILKKKELYAGYECICLIAHKSKFTHVKD